MRRFWCWIGGHIPAIDNIIDNLEHPWREPRSGEPTATQETKITVVSHRLLVRERVCIRCGAALGAKETK